jgi:hypothetical protein
MEFRRKISTSYNAYMHVIGESRIRKENLKVGFQFLPQNRMFPLNFLERPHTSALLKILEVKIKK